MGRPAGGLVAAAHRKHRLVALGSVVLLCLLAWAYLFWQAAGMDAAAGMAAPQMREWTAADLGFLLPMWIVMMGAMMLPSAAPMIVLFTSVDRRRRSRDAGRGRREAPDRGGIAAATPTTLFVLGYLLIWTGFSVAAASTQWLLHRAALLSPDMVSASPVLGGALLVAAGLFQWTPLKNVCIAKCRSPLAFLMSEWREGAGGALVMGLRHGAYCVGCCWALMSLLFVLGVMNLLWVAALSVLVLIEKTAPGGAWITRSTGVVLVAWGAWLLAAPVV